MKRIHIETLGDKSAKVYRDSEYDEFRVRLYIDGKLNALADYFTNDKTDAIDSALAMVQPARLRPLSVAFNVAVLHIASRVLPCGFDVSSKAPQDFESLLAHYDKTGRILVWNGASEQTIFADSEVNFAFRAWHDSKHITGGFNFMRKGEISAMRAQQMDVVTLYNGPTMHFFCDLIKAEVQGQFDYKERRGGFPVDQLAFVRAYLCHAETALDGAFGISAEGT